MFKDNKAFDHNFFFFLVVLSSFLENKRSEMDLPSAQTKIFYLSAKMNKPTSSSTSTTSTPQKRSQNTRKTQIRTPQRRPRRRKAFSTPRRANTVSRIVSSAERGVFSKAAMKQSMEKVKEDVDTLTASIAQLEEKYSEEELDTLIHKLHVYNDLKDVAQAVLGVLARDKGMTTKEMYTKYDLNMED
eukprot:m.125473 g.125473  ORF g.125473 m.125473 type:complete len:187 (+) comp12982_c0_seq2:132-692(+)